MVIVFIVVNERERMSGRNREGRKEGVRVAHARLIRHIRAYRALWTELVWMQHRSPKNSTLITVKQCMWWRSSRMLSSVIL